MKKFLCTSVLALLCLLCLQAGAQEIALPVVGGVVSVHTSEVEDEEWLFLPSFAKLSELYPDAAAVDEEGVWLDEASNLHIMKSENLRTFFLFSSDPVNAGREWIEDCPRHENETTGWMAIVNTDGHVEHADDLRQLRGRGNGTWIKDKRPYQFKLKNRADLLKTGDSSERSRTWVLLAEAMDGTHLHNRIALDMGLELGMENTSHSEFVDLYYDGEYRGLYLLAEKVEIDEARIDELDYEKLLESWNKSIGQYDLETLAAGTQTNRFGNEFHYIENVADNGNVDQGAYLLERESTIYGPTFAERCYFHLDDQTIFSLKSPKNASEPMVRYISERFREARETLKNGGVHPDNGRTIEDDFDVDGFARLVLLNELFYNVDGFTYSSTYFVLPAGETRFKAGPVWDFDLSMRYLRNHANEAATGFKDWEGWTTEFYSCDAFLETAKRIYLEELQPLVNDILLGNERGTYLQSLTAYADAIAKAGRMNAFRWSMGQDGRFVYGKNHAEELELLRKFITERNAWLTLAMNDLRPGENHLALWMYGRYGYPETGMRVFGAPWQGAEVVSLVAEQLSEADEENFALWQLEAVVALPQDMENPTLSVNGTELSYEQQEDGTIRFCVTFEDPSYRPVDYYGEDIGLVYQYEDYIRRYPEIAEMCEYDPEAVMDYFCDEGMYEGQIGNAYFDPQKALELNPWLVHAMGEDWQLYYWDYITYGHEEGWMKDGSEHFVPQVEDAL